QLLDIHKQFVRGSERIEVLRGVNLDVANGELLGRVGPSGSGKTTLLSLIAGLDRPTAGEVIVAGDRLSTMDEAKIAKWRSSHIGFVFQFYHLIPVLTAFENVELPLLLFNMPASKRRQQVQLTLELVGRKNPLHHPHGAVTRCAA